MADYIYLLENRLSPAQQSVIRILRPIARQHEMTIFLTGGAVRDLTGGGSVRDLDFTLQGDVYDLRQELEAAGGVLVGEDEAARALHFVFSGGIRAEIASAVTVTFPKPGKPEYQISSISDDLRQRDFTANSMALSLNEGSYGLLMDPLNGVADIENHELRLVSNYGFIEDPSRLIRAARLTCRLGWQMEERTKQRYANARDEDYIANISPRAQSVELEALFHEEDPLRLMRHLASEGWLATLSPALKPEAANSNALNELADRQGQLQTQGILADSSALAFPLLTSKLPAADVAAIKAAFANPGFAREIDSVEERTREFTARFSKEATSPSAVWKFLHAADPGLVLSLLSTARGSAQAKLKTFLNDSPGVRSRIPYALLTEMRITPDLPAYAEVLDKLFFELMDGHLATTEELKAFLEPYSPPAPPPPVNLRRARTKKEPRAGRGKAKKAAALPDDLEDAPVIEQEEEAGVEAGILDPGTLTGPDRSAEPDHHEPIEANAPLGAETSVAVNDKPQGTPDAPAIRAKAKSQARTGTAADSSAVTQAKETARRAVAAKLNATPAMDPKDAKRVEAHPLARQVAKERAIVVVPPATTSPTSSKASAGKTSASAAKAPASAPLSAGKAVAPKVAGATRPAPTKAKVPSTGTGTSKLVAKKSVPAKVAPVKQSKQTGAQAAAKKVAVKAAPAKKVTEPLKGGTSKSVKAPVKKVPVKTVAKAAAEKRVQPAAKAVAKTTSKPAQKTPAKAAKAAGKKGR